MSRQRRLHLAVNGDERMPLPFSDSCNDGDEQTATITSNKNQRRLFAQGIFGFDTGCLHRFVSCASTRSISQMKVVARMMSGKEITVECFPVHTVNDVKRQIEEYALIPADQQRLFYDGKELDGNRVLFYYDIRFMVNTLDLVLVRPAVDGLVADESCVVDVEM